MTRDTERLVIRCDEDIKRAFQMYAGAYSNQGEALAALLDAYATEPGGVEVVDFEVNL